MGGHVFYRTSLAGGHVLREAMYYGRMCLMRGHVLQEDIFYGKTS